MADLVLCVVNSKVGPSSLSINEFVGKIYIFEGATVVWWWSV